MSESIEDTSLDNLKLRPIICQTRCCIYNAFKFVA